MVMEISDHALLTPWTSVIHPCNDGDQLSVLSVLLIFYAQNRHGDSGPCPVDPKNICHTSMSWRQPTSCLMLVLLIFYAQNGHGDIRPCPVDPENICHTSRSWRWPTFCFLLVLLAATKQLYKWYFPSVCPSVRPSHLLNYVPIIGSSWNFQELLPVTEVTSMQKVKVKGQGHRGHNPSLPFPDCNSSLNSRMMKWCI